VNASAQPSNILIGALWLLFCASVADAVEVPTQTIQAVKASVVAISCLANDPQHHIEGVAGTGFLINRAGSFVTANHVLVYLQSFSAQHSCRPIIYIPAGGWTTQMGESTSLRAFPFDLIACAEDAAADIAACQTESNPFDNGYVAANIKPVTFNAVQQADGTDIAFMGFPLGYENPVTAKSYVAAYNQSDTGQPQVMMDQPIWQGASGGPVFISDGTIIGIVLSGGLENATGLSFARPAKVIIDFLNGHNFKIEK
jgi:S1-C subfamily serine protease